jgi:hypothetical protein
MPSVMQGNDLVEADFGLSIFTIVRGSFMHIIINAL